MFSFADITAELVADLRIETAFVAFVDFGRGLPATVRLWEIVTSESQLREDNLWKKSDDPRSLIASHPPSAPWALSKRRNTQRQKVMLILNRDLIQRKRANRACKPNHPPGCAHETIATLSVPPTFVHEIGNGLTELRPSHNRRLSVNNTNLAKASTYNVMPSLVETPKHNRGCPPKDGFGALCLAATSSMNKKYWCDGKTMFKH